MYEANVYSFNILTAFSNEIKASIAYLGVDLFAPAIFHIEIRYTNRQLSIISKYDIRTMSFHYLTPQNLATMKTLRKPNQPQIVQYFVLKDNIVLKSILYSDKCQKTVNHYIKYYLDDIEISREIFDIYKHSYKI